MAKADMNVKVELSAADRQLLRDIRDALRGTGVASDGAVEVVRRLIESSPEDDVD